MLVNERPVGHAPGHARHDRLLVARFVGGDAAANEATEARRQIEQCHECGSLANDLRLLHTSIAQLPTPPRTRNFRLTQAQADALRGSPVERFLRRLSAPGLTMLRPVAGVALAMGLVVAVVGAGLPGTAPIQDGRTTFAGPPASEGAQPSPQPPGAAQDTGKQGQTIEMAPSDTPGTYPAYGPGTASADRPSWRPEPSQPLTAVVEPTASERAAPAGPTDTNAAASPDTRVLLIYGGVTLAMFAFALLLLAWFARRRLEDPLLR